MEKELAEVAKRNARFKREIAKLVNENRTLHARVDQLEQQGRSAFDFVFASVEAHFCGLSPPSLLPSDS